MALNVPSSRLQIDDEAAQAFEEAIARFAGTLTENEQAVLSEVMRRVMDPWSKALLDPPELSESEATCLDDLEDRTDRSR